MYTHCRERGPVGGQVWGGGETCFPGESRHRVEGAIQAAVPSPRPPLSCRNGRAVTGRMGCPVHTERRPWRRPAGWRQPTGHRQQSRQWEQRSRQSPVSCGMRGPRSSCWGRGPNSVGAAGPPAAVCDRRECSHRPQLSALLPLPTPSSEIPGIRVPACEPGGPVQPREASCSKGKPRAQGGVSGGPSHTGGRQRRHTGSRSSLGNSPPELWG